MFKKAWSYNGRATAYYYDDHPDLDDMMRVLENLGLISNVSYNDVKRYRMSEPFAEYLCGTRPSSQSAE